MSAFWGKRTPLRGTLTFALGGSVVGVSKDSCDYHCTSQREGKGEDCENLFHWEMWRTPLMH